MAIKSKLVTVFLLGTNYIFLRTQSCMQHLYSYVLLRIHSFINGIKTVMHFLEVSKNISYKENIIIKVMNIDNEHYNPFLYPKNLMSYASRGYMANDN